MLANEPGQKVDTDHPGGYGRPGCADGRHANGYAAMSVLVWLLMLFSFGLMGMWYCVRAYYFSLERRWWPCFWDAFWALAMAYVLWDMNFGSMALNQ